MSKAPVEFVTLAAYPSSSEPGIRHLVKSTEDCPEVLFCSCRGFKFKDKCVHIDTFLAEQAGQEAEIDNPD